MLTNRMGLRECRVGYLVLSSGTSEGKKRSFRQDSLLVSLLLCELSPSTKLFVFQGYLQSAMKLHYCPVQPHL